MLTVFLWLFGGLVVTIDRKTMQIYLGFNLIHIYILIDKQADKKFLPNHRSTDYLLLSFCNASQSSSLYGSPVMPQPSVPGSLYSRSLGRVDRPLLLFSAVILPPHLEERHRNNALWWHALPSQRSSRKMLHLGLSSDNPQVVSLGPRHKVGGCCAFLPTRETSIIGN